MKQPKGCDFTRLTGLTWYQCPICGDIKKDTDIQANTPIYEFYKETRQ